MPDVPQLDWGKLRPENPEYYKHNKKPADIYWRYKKKIKPETTSRKHGKVKRKKTKLKDRSIVRQDISNQRHLRSIMREEF